MRISTTHILAGQEHFPVHQHGAHHATTRKQRASFMAIGAYVTTWLTMPPTMKQLFLEFPDWLSFLYDAQYEWWVGLIAGVVVAGIVGLVTGLMLIRLSGIQASIATLALLLITYVIASNAEDLTQGLRTVVGVPQDVGLGTATACAMAVLLIAYAYQRSGTGERLRASRESEAAAAALGINVARERLIAFVISAAVVGAGGVLYAHYSVGFSPNHFYLDRTFVIVAMVLIGGRYSLVGTVIGVVTISTVDEILRRLEHGVILFERFLIQLPTGSGSAILGALMLVAIVVRCDGIVGPQGVQWPRRLLSGRLPRVHDASTKTS